MISFIVFSSTLLCEFLEVIGVETARFLEAVFNFLLSRIAGERVEDLFDRLSYDLSFSREV